MGFLKKIRNNILNQQNSFHIGFGNRSPFSYRGKYSGDWTSEVPNLETSAYGQPEMDLGETKLLKAQMDTIGKVSDAVTGVAKAYIKKEAKENCTGTWDAKNEKCVSQNDSANNDYYKNQFSIRQDHYDKIEEDRQEELERKRQKAGIPTQEELDNIGFTH